MTTVNAGDRVSWGEVVMKDGKAVVIPRVGTVEKLNGSRARVRQDHSSFVPELPVSMLRKEGGR